jgi:hypothetical protein
MSFRAALEIDLHAPGLIKIVGVTENRLVLVAGVNGANDEFVVLAVITGFDVGLWVDIEVRDQFTNPTDSRYGSFVSNPNSVPKIHSSGLNPRKTANSPQLVRPISACNS